MKNVYFLSDAHLGSRAIEHGRTQERRLVNFLDSIKHKASAVYLLGDMFDFWYEFRLVVPKSMGKNSILLTVTDWAIRTRNLNYSDRCSIAKLCKRCFQLSIPVGVWN